MTNTENQNQIAKKTVNGMFWKFLEKIFSQGIQLIIQIVLARLLLPEEYGLVGLLAIFISISDVFILQGLTTALIQKKNADETDFSSVFIANIIISLLLYGILFAIAPFVARFYHEPKLKELMRVLSLNVIIGAIPAVHNAILSKELDFRKSFYRNISNVLTQGIVGIALAILGWGAWAMVYSKLAGVAVGAVVLCVTVKWRPQKMFSIKRVKSLFHYSSKVLGTNLLNTTFNNMHSLVIGKYYSTTDVGYYQRGQQIPQTVMTALDGSMSEVLYPAYSKVQDDKVLLKKAVRKSVSVSMYIVFPVLVGLLVVAEPLTLLLLTEKWLPSVPFMQFSCVICMFWPLSHRTHALNALGKSGTTLAISLVGKSITLIAIFSCLKFGIYALMIGTIIASFINMWISSYYVKKHIDYSIKELAIDVLPPLLLSVIMGGAVYCVSFIGLHDIITLAIQVVLGVGIYIFGSWLFKLESFGYLLSIVKGFLRKRGKSSLKSNEKTAKQPSIDEIEKFLNAVDKEFPVPLSQKTDLHEYAIKLYEHATIFFVEQDGKIAAMVAGYTDNVENDMAYISLLATREEYRGQGYAKRLVNEFLECAKNKNLSATHLYAVETNERAVQLYYKLGFEKYMPEMEPRKDDLHLIFRVKKDKKI
ncbi:MAG: GNAT family N-acetyltransferase [Clostridiales bacterium]|nr:GNAT family N-acetyltransferase [Clostridiales bacterium]